MVQPPIVQLQLRSEILLSNASTEDLWDLEASQVTKLQSFINFQSVYDLGWDFFYTLRLPLLISAVGFF